MMPSTHGLRINPHQIDTNTKQKSSVYLSLQFLNACEDKRQNSKTKRPPGNRVASSSRENSSNGALKFRQNFLPKSYESKNRGVKGFL